MNRAKYAVTLMVGILLGTLLGGPAAQAAAEYFQAGRSYQPIYVDGKLVDLEAYGINGHNYVKLRDIGQAVGFNVYWDETNSTVQVVSDQPYTGLPPAQETPAPAEEVDYSREANPAIFNGELSREVYNAIRDTVVNQEAILAGSKQPIPMGQVTLYGPVDEATIAIGGYPTYEIARHPDGGYACNARYPEAYKEAAAHTQSFVDGLAGKSDREKVSDIAWYVADRITYAVAYPGPNVVLTQDGQVPGACMAYAYSFQFLCDRVGIPCILVHSDTHQWNMVYLEGQWWGVDVTGLDTGDETRFRDSMTVLNQPIEMQGTAYRDAEPEVTIFAQELLAPGSTK